MLKPVLVAVLVLLAATVAQPQQLNDSLTIGQSLVNGQKLVSAQGIFVLGFFSNGDSSYLGIWYNYLIPQTIVWVANRDTPIKGGNGSVFVSTSSLDLLDRRGNKVWSSGTLNTNSPQAFLLDSGNLIINDSTSENPNPLWQGFDQPCDTLLSDMRIGYDMSTNHNVRLRSWKSNLDPSPGDYYIGLDPNRLPELLLFQGTLLIYRTGPWNGRSIQWRLVASSDGRAHRWHSNTSNEWVEYWHLPQDQCDAYAYCGPNAACYNSDCHCLQEFVPKSESDWNQRTYAGGCVRDVVLPCSSPMGHGFAHLSHVKVPDTLNATMVVGKGWDDCRKLCLGNCSCSAYTVFGDSDCVTWSGDLVDIVQLTEGINDLYTRISHGDPSHSHRDRYIAIIVSVSTIGTMLVFSALLGFCYHRTRQKHLPLSNEVFRAEHELAPGPKLAAPLEKNLDLDTIRVSTNNFSKQNIIASIRSRTIYKGILPNFSDLAVKRLNVEIGLVELNNEVKMLARLDHPNIIRILGSCIGNNENMICYEYMTVGSLDAVLFAEDEKSGVPDWSSHFHIMQGICEGLLYLHEHCRIVHRNIDPSNILLSEGFIPKISGFGHATVLDLGLSEGKAVNFRGTFGYRAPELFYGGEYSVKSDVYSFGLVLLETVTGSKATSFCREDTDDFPRYVRQHWTQGTADQLKDPRIGDPPKGELERCIHIGVRCVQEDPAVRPTMSFIRNTLSAIRPY